MSDRVSKFSEAEFEAGVKRLVAKLFEANRALPDEVTEIPVIAAMQGFKYSSRAPRDMELEQLVAAALLARHWFKTSEGPPWAQPLLLSARDCCELLSRDPSNHRNRLPAEYALLLREMWWRIDRAPRFEVFCAHKLAAPPPEPYGRRSYRSGSRF